MSDMSEKDTFIQELIDNALKTAETPIADETDRLFNNPFNIVKDDAIILEATSEENVEESNTLKTEENVEEIDVSETEETEVQNVEEENTPSITPIIEIATENLEEAETETVAEENTEEIVVSDTPTSSTPQEPITTDSTGADAENNIQEETNNSEDSAPLEESVSENIENLPDSNEESQKEIIENTSEIVETGSTSSVLENTEIPVENRSELYESAVQELNDIRAEEEKEIVRPHEKSEIVKIKSRFSRRSVINKKFAIVSLIFLVLGLGLIGAGVGMFINKATFDLITIILFSVGAVFVVLFAVFQILANAKKRTEFTLKITSTVPDYNGKKVDADTYSALVQREIKRIKKSL